MEIAQNDSPLDMESSAFTEEFPEEQFSEDPTKVYSLHQSNTEKITILPVDALATASNAPELLQFGKQITTNLSSLTAASIFSSILPSATVVRSRKPRLKIEKSVTKTSDSSDLLVDISSEVFELSTDGVKKKSALESVNQVQSLFKFIPRGSCASSDASLSQKLCKGIRVAQLLSECTTKSSSSVENDNLDRNTAEFSGDHYDESVTAISKSKLHNFLHGDDRNRDNIRSNVNASEYLQGVEELDVPLLVNGENELKIFTKSKLNVKDDKKKTMTNMGINSSLPSVALDNQLIRINCPVPSRAGTTQNDISVMDDNSSHCVRSHDACSILSEVDKKSVEVSLHLDNPEKSKGKRKHNFHQPVSMKLPIISRISDETETLKDNMDVNIDFHAEKDLGSYFHGIKEQYHTQGPVSQNNTDRNLPTIANVEIEAEVVGSDGVVFCDGGSERDKISSSSSSSRNGFEKQHVDETSESEGHDISPRTSFSIDDNENNTANTADRTTTRATKLEKKESIKRLPKETKEYAMNEVPGRLLLGPKMLSFIRAFPEGDVQGNDDVETVHTQRVRMEEWLHTMKNQNSSLELDTYLDNSCNDALNCGVEEMIELRNQVSVKSEHSKLNLDDINRIKYDLLNEIEEKLLKAPNWSGRGNHSTSTALKPGIVQILSQYEVWNT